MGRAGGRTPSGTPVRCGRMFSEVVSDTDEHRYTQMMETAAPPSFPRKREPGAQPHCPSTLGSRFRGSEGMWLLFDVFRMKKSRPSGAINLSAVPHSTAWNLAVLPGRPHGHLCASVFICVTNLSGRSRRLRAGVPRQGQPTARPIRVHSCSFVSQTDGLPARAGRRVQPRSGSPTVRSPRRR